MKIKLQRDHFINGLQQVINVVGTKSTMPILSNVLLEANGDTLALSTTNLDIGVRCQIRAEVHHVGAITLPVRKLAAIVKSLAGSELILEATDHQAKITCGSSQFRMVGLPAADFPSLPSFPNAETCTLSQDIFAQMLKNVSYAQSTDENRYVLNSVLVTFQESGKIVLAATDGRRLALAEHTIDADMPAGSGNIILPARTATELERVLQQGEHVKLALSERQIAFAIEVSGEKSGLVGTIHIVSKLIDGSFPNYRQVVPKELVNKIKLDRALFLECIQRAALVVSEKNPAINIKIANNLLEISAFSSEYGESHEEIAVDYSGPEVRKLAFNPQFLLDPLRAMTHDEVSLEFKDEMSPGVLRAAENFLCVIMPLRV